MYFSIGDRNTPHKNLKKLMKERIKPFMIFLISDNVEELVKNMASV
jgi:hypothetical protein